MPVINLIPSHSTQTCSISDSGILSFPRQVTQQLGWQVPCKIAVSYLDSPLALMFRSAENDQPSFTLSYQARRVTPQTGTKLRCTTFIRTVLGRRLELPLRGLSPLILSDTPPVLVLIAQGPKWATEDFSQSGLKRIPSDRLGAYQLLGASGTVLCIGEGVISDRLREHLKEDRLVSAVRSIQYFLLTDKEETQLWQQLLLTQYDLQNGQLPPLNRIRA